MDLKINADRFTGKVYVETYHQYRPTPPIEVINQSLNYLNHKTADIILDLGSGTGISTQIWSDYANQVIGIEPSIDMLSVARRQNKIANISYIEGYSNETNIPTSSADIVACSQSFHWMEPMSTLKEVNRILKPNGVFVVIDTLWPPNVSFEYENTYNELFRQVDELTKNLEEKIPKKWDKTKHLKNINSCSHFNFIKQACYHKRVSFNKERFVGIAQSQGGLKAFNKRGYSDEQTCLQRFKRIIESLDEPTLDEMGFNYQVIFAIK